ncbi:MAG: hypothetical protein D6732_15865 [Methanobacteriota archaeon]|nr:MAG: hypothetical protein D6732_15865 [Euryarchaeota archaeon]
MVLPALKSGTSWVWKNKKVVMIYYFFNLIFGLIIIFPLRSSLKQYLGSSMMGKLLAGRINMDFLIEFLLNNKHVVPSLLGMVFIASLLYWLSHLFLSGGTLSLLANNQNYSAEPFWGKCARFLGRFLRLFLLSIPLLLILLSLQYIVTGVEKLFWGSDPYENVIYWGKWIKAFVRGFGLILYMIVFDYARIFTIHTDSRRMRTAMWESMMFCRKNFGNVFMLAFTFSLITYLSLFIYNPVANLLSAPYGVVIFGLFLWQQLYMIFRMGIKVSLLGGEVYLFQHFSQPADTSEESLSSEAVPTMHETNEDEGIPPETE